MAEPSMSMRLVSPFLTTLKKQGIDPRVLRFLEHADPDSRVLASTALDLLRIAVRITQDEALGLRAALETSPGDYGDVEYASGSCTTLGEALDFLSRYYFTLDGSCTLRHRCVDGRVQVLFHQPREPFCRAMIDFTLSMAFLAYVRWVNVHPSDYEVCFPYPAPADLDPYKEVFGSRTRLTFDASCTAATFPEQDLRYPLRFSDEKLHSLLAEHLRHRYLTQGLEPSLSDSVRSLIMDELPNGSASSSRIASRLGMSKRSLSRKLDEEGTTFKNILGNVRLARAVHDLLLESHSISEISVRLGYSESAAFHRAFRKWFGSSPSAYRRARRAR